MTSKEDIVERVARAILKTRFYDIEPDAYDGLDDFWASMDRNDHIAEAEYEARAAIEASEPKWQDISTVPPGEQVIVWEPMYGWLLAMLDSRSGWLIKSSGNFYADMPPEVTPIYWQPVPDYPGRAALSQGEDK